MQVPTFKVSEFVDSLNQTLEYAYPVVEVVGEVSGFAVKQDKFVFFGLKDERSFVNCFMMAFKLSIAIENGMKVKIRARPKLRNTGRFSLAVESVVPEGEGSLMRAFNLLKEKLEKEGLFDKNRKRPIPTIPCAIGLISSETAAGSTDFLTILSQRFGGFKVHYAHVRVQGEGAAEEIIDAIAYFNRVGNVDEIVIVRGGGSMEDLWVFNDERLVRAIAASEIPVVVGVGHEEDVTLADLAADVRAATPTDAANIIVPDRREWLFRLGHLQMNLEAAMRHKVISVGERFRLSLTQHMGELLSRHSARTASLKSALAAHNPHAVLARGYSIIMSRNRVITSAGQVRAGDEINAKLYDGNIKAKVEDGKKTRS